jgi:hypothetical protein
MNRTMRVVLVALVVLALAGCGGEGVSAPTAQPTASPVPTPAPAAPTAASQLPATDAGPTPSPPVHSDALVGSSRTESAAGTVRGDDGETPDVDLPGIDLLAVEVEGSGTELWVYWYTAQTAPTGAEAGQTIVWAVEIWMDGQPLYDLVVRWTHNARQILIVDRETGEEDVLRLASVFADRVEAPYWGYLLPKITGPFQWIAYASWTDETGQTWMDRAPDVDGSQPTDEWGAFPGT